MGFYDTDELWSLQIVYQWVVLQYVHIYCIIFMRATTQRTSIWPVRFPDFLLSVFDFRKKKYFVEFMHCTLDNNMFLFCLFFYYFLVTIICSISLLLHIRCVEISLNFVCAHRMSPGMNCRVCTDWNLYRNFPTIMSHAHTKTHTTSEYVV